MARKKKHEEHENHERWLVSYADFITLLFAFFVVMYSISSVNEGKFRVLSESLVASFRSQNKSLAPIQIGQSVKSPINDNLSMRKVPVAVQMPSMPMTIAKPSGFGKGQSAGKDPIKVMSGQIRKAMGKLIDKGLIDVRQSKDKLEVEIKSSILFASGSARLSDDALPVVEQLAKILQPFPNPVYVEGHTDSIPISTVHFPSNWELSTARASSVVHLFSKQNIDPTRMAALGFGEHRPVADNETAEGRAQNRRVVLVVHAVPGQQDVMTALENLAPEDEPVDETSMEAMASAETPAESVPDVTTPSEATVSTPSSAVHTQRYNQYIQHQKPGVFPVIAPPIQLPQVIIQPITIQPITALPKPVVDRIGGVDLP